MTNRLGFIGTGNMGSAMIKSLVRSGTIDGNNIIISDADPKKAELLANETGVKSAKSNKEVLENSDIVILAVKPNMLKNVLEPLKNDFNKEKILVSVAVGIPISFYKKIIGQDIKVVRTMPNTPAMVGEGMTLVSFDQIIKENEKETILKIFESLGKVETLEEKLMSEVTAVTGSSPAYVFIFIEAMADAAVQSGIPRNLAYKLSAQAVLGSAKMVLDTGKHPGELKDNVCSPAGTTIDAVVSLEKNGFRYSVIEAMNECTKRAREIGKLYE